MFWLSICLFSVKWQTKFFSVKFQDSKSETKLGRALLKIIYDDDVYGARIIAVKISEAAGNGNGGGEIENEDETYLCNHIIAVQTNLDVDEDRNRCSWSAFDFSDDPPTYRTFAAEFSQSESTDEAQAEFVSVFQEGKELAEQVNYSISRVCFRYISNV